MVEAVCYGFKLFHHAPLKHCRRVLSHLFYASFHRVSQYMELVFNLSCHPLAVSYIITVLHLYLLLSYV